MGAFVLTAPLLLTGLTLLALPLLAHWLHRRARRTVVFPSIALLIEAAAQQSRLHRLRRWLLLSLRLLAVACIVLAFTRPVWQSAAAGVGASGDATALVLLIDVSLSAAQSASGVSELTALQAAANGWLDQLQPGLDLCGIVIADADPHPVFPRLTANVAGLREELSRLAATFERADLPAALAVAGQLLSTHNGPRRLVIVSDLQRSNWIEVLESPASIGAIPQGVVVSVVARTGNSPNVSLSRPRCFPAQPLPGEPFDLTVNVRSSIAATQQTRVTCLRTAGVGRDTVVGRDEQQVVLEPGEERETSFHIAAFDGQRQFAQFDVDVRDALPADNTCWLVVHAVERTPVAIVSDDDARQVGTTGYYLERALAPATDASTRFVPVSVRPAALSTESLRRFPVVVLGYVASLGPETASILAEHVRTGGGLVVFAGDGAVDRNLLALQAAGEGRLLPWAPGPRRTAASRWPAVRLQSGRWQSRWLRSFDEQSQLALEAIQFAQVWSAGAVSPAAEVLLTFDDGSPAVGVRTFDRGQIVVCNFSPEATTSDLARHGAFVALAQVLVQGALPAAADWTMPVVGQPVVWSGLAPDSDVERLTGTGPDGEPLVLTLRDAGAGRVVSLPRSTRPGLHCVEQAGAVLDAVAVAVDERESRLERVPAAEIEQRLSAAGARVVATAAGEHGDVPALRGRPLWGEFLSAAALATALELLLLGWWRR